MKTETRICPVGNHSFEAEVKRGTKRIYCSDQHQILAAGRRAVVRQAGMAVRRCSRCKQEKASEEFSGPTAPYCRPCHSEYELSRRHLKAAADPAYTRMVNLRRYGLTPETFAAMITAQNGKCAICGRDEPGGQGVWHVDRDHRCCATRKISCGRCIRGLLCTRCNIGLGNFGDRPEVIRASADYLDAHASRVAVTDGAAGHLRSP